MLAEHEQWAPPTDDRDFDEMSEAEQEKARNALFEAMREIAHADLAYPVDDCAICRAKVF